MLRRIRGYLVTGLISLFPLVATYVTLTWLFRKVDSLSRPLVWLALRSQETVPGLGVLLGILFVILIGALVDLAGRKLVHQIESWILRLPLVKSIYGLARNLTDAIFGGQKQAFQKAALIQYPRLGTFTLAFVTGQVGTYYSLFIPTTPNPTSGWYLLAPEDEVVVLNMPVDAALKLIISGGVISLNADDENELCAAVERLAGRRGCA